MKKMIMAGLVGLVLFVAAIGLGSYGYYQVILARAQEHIDRMEYVKAEKVYADFEQEQLYFLRLPWADEMIGRHLRWKKSELRYWQEKYAEFVAQAQGSDPEIQFIQGNSFYRAIQHETDRKKVLEFLDTALQIYAGVIKNEPGSFNAVYNYEYLHRVRDQVAQGKRPLPLKIPGQKTLGDQSRTNLPGEGQEGTGREKGPAIHGQPGQSSGVAGRRDQIKVHTPTTNEENPDLGPGIGKESIKKKKG